jgi:CRISPR/Cas system CMR-associated protein Cmr5 small subunit
MKHNIYVDKLNEIDVHDKIALLKEAFDNTLVTVSTKLLKISNIRDSYFADLKREGNL